MSEYKLPETITDRLSKLTDEQCATLKNNFKYPVNLLKEDVKEHFQRLIRINQRDEESQPLEKATTVLSEQIDRFMQALDKATKSGNTPTQNYETIYEGLSQHDKLNYLLIQLSFEREKIANKYEHLPKRNISDIEYSAERDKLGFEYLAKKRDLIRKEVEAAISDSDIFYFAGRGLEKKLDKTTHISGHECDRTFHLINYMVASAISGKSSAVVNKGNNQATIEGLDEIIETLEASLSNYGIDERTLEELDLYSGLLDRFSAIKTDEISISRSDVESISGELFKKITNADEQEIDKLDILDYAATELFESADFNKTKEVIVDFNRRLGEPPHQINKPQLGISTNVALAGAGLSIAASWAHRVAQSDGIESQHAKTKEKTQHLQRKRNRGLAFATVASITGTMVLLDGLLLKGHYTKMILDGAKNMLDSRSK